MSPPPQAGLSDGVSRPGRWKRSVEHRLNWSQLGGLGKHRGPGTQTEKKSRCLFTPSPWTPNSSRLIGPCQQDLHKSKAFKLAWVLIKLKGAEEGIRAKDTEEHGEKARETTVAGAQQECCEQHKQPLLLPPCWLARGKPSTITPSVMNSQFPRSPISQALITWQMFVM